ncbi:hypothetical protein GOP47_0007788 [Adiantum capillus-veneris]|uniref:Uncharacterized protein n=1 Tax=Adiantum capillus-veneris TaxID=13818 RepID=A0A9D4ZJN1_ADICA|nr:hypothetical protein GOP47_0007788 [Adiantum capillus-veneris]
MEHAFIVDNARNGQQQPRRGPTPTEIVDNTKFMWVDLNNDSWNGPIPLEIGHHVDGLEDPLHGLVFAFIHIQYSGCRGLETLLEFAFVTPEALTPTPSMNS